MQKSFAAYWDGSAGLGPDNFFRKMSSRRGPRKKFQDFETLPQRHESAQRFHRDIKTLLNSMSSLCALWRCGEKNLLTTNSHTFLLTYLTPLANRLQTSRPRQEEYLFLQ